MVRRERAKLGLVLLGLWFDSTTFRKCVVTRDGYFNKTGEITPARGTVAQQSRMILR